MKPETNIIDWDFVIDSIERQKCILFLGPELFKLEAGKSLEEELCEHLNARDPDNEMIRAFYEEDGFFLFRRNGDEVRIISKIRRFFKKSFPNTEGFLEKISKIPFHLIITLTPDNLLPRVFERQDLPYQQDFYFKHRPPGQFQKPSSKHPLIYNMLGNIQEDESLVLTHNDLFDYLESIFVAKSMHMDLRTELSNANNYIFLGIPFEKWYMQLLLRILELHTDSKLSRYALHEKLEDRFQSFYNQQFRIEFIPDNVNVFMDSLYQRCEAEGLLKSAKQPAAAQSSKSNFERIKELIGLGDVEGAIEKIRRTLELLRPHSESLMDAFDLIKTRKELLDFKLQLNNIDEQTYGMENEKIAGELWMLSQRAEKLKPASNG